MRKDDDTDRISAPEMREIIRRAIKANRLEIEDPGKLAKYVKDFKTAMSPVYDNYSDKAIIANPAFIQYEDNRRAEENSVRAC